MTLVRSHLSHCVQPRLVKDITTLERIQRATIFILNDYTIDYKTRLQKLHLLPLGLWFDLYDLLFLVKCLNDEEDNIEIGKFVTFSNSRTRAGSSGLILQINSRTSHCCFTQMKSQHLVYHGNLISTRYTFLGTATNRKRSLAYVIHIVFRLPV